MDLDESQRKKVAEWVAEGLKLSEIQNRLQSELGVRMTYMEVRLLVDDLKLTPKDVEIPKAPASSLAAPGPAPNAKPAQKNAPPAPGRAGPAPAGSESINIRPRFWCAAAIFGSSMIARENSCFASSERFSPA